MVHERHFLPENDKKGHFFPNLKFIYPCKMPPAKKSGATCYFFDQSIFQKKTFVGPKFRFFLACFPLFARGGGLLLFYEL